MPSVNQVIIDIMTKRSINLLQYNQLLANKIKTTLDDLSEELKKTLLNSNINNLQGVARKKALNLLFSQTNTIINSIYNDIKDEVKQELSSLVAIESSFITTQLNTVIGASIAVPIINDTVINSIASKSLLFKEDLLSYFNKQSAETFKLFKKNIRLGLASGESTSQLVNRLVGGTDGFGNTQIGFMNIRKSQAEALVRTAVSTVSNNTYKKTYEENTDIIMGIQEVETLDKRTCPISMAYNGCAWKLPNHEPIVGFGSGERPYAGGLPRHWNERGIIVPLLKPFSELGIDVKEKIPPYKQASMDGAVEMPATFDDFLKKRTVAEQNEMLGAGKAALWRSGKITTSDLVNQRGRELTLKELNEKYD